MADCRECSQWETCPCGKIGHKKGTSYGYSIGECREYEKKRNNVIDISANEPHKASEVICVKCGNRWIAVRPETTLLKHLHCPQCENKGFVIETGEEIDD